MMQDVIVIDRIIDAFLITILLIITIITILQKKESRFINWFNVLSVSLISLVVAALTLYKMGYIVDEFNLEGDSVALDMCIAIGILCVINPIIYFKRNERK